MEKQFPLEQIIRYNMEEAIFEMSSVEMKKDTIEEKDVRSWALKSEGKRFRLCNRIKLRFQMIALEMEKNIVMHYWLLKKKFKRYKEYRLYKMSA